MAIIILSPFVIIIMAILKVTGEGYIFYRQKRIGQYGEPFMLIKFTTMLSNSLNMEGGGITLRNDHRILPFGKFLRKTKINELPQIFNVWLGDMSIIGPRPMIPEHFHFYNDDVKNIISKFKPGLSGIASLIFRDEEKYFVNKDAKKNKMFYKNEISPYKGELECWYCRNQSMITDLLIIINTIVLIISTSSRLYNIFFKNLPKHPTFNPG